LLKQCITELEDENAEVKAKNAKLKHENTKLKQIIEENAEFKAKIVKLEQAVDKIEKRDQSINNDSQRELVHSCQVNTPKQIVDTTIRPCLSTADVIRSDVNQESSNSDLSTVAISSSFVTLSESEQSDELISPIEKNLIVKQELMQQLSVIIGGASTAENKESHITAETKASESSISHVSDSSNSKDNISISPTST
ncbi:33361_t:CDS:2, partial [Racocetra persica]